MTPELGRDEPYRSVRCPNEFINNGRRDRCVRAAGHSERLCKTEGGFAFMPRAIEPRTIFTRVDRAGFLPDVCEHKRGGHVCDREVWHEGDHESKAGWAWLDESEVWL